MRIIEAVVEDDLGWLPVGWPFQTSSSMPFPTKGNGFLTKSTGHGIWPPVPAAAAFESDQSINGRSNWRDKGLPIIGPASARKASPPQSFTDPDRIRHPVKRRGKRGDGDWEKNLLEEGIRLVTGRLQGPSQEGKAAESRGDGRPVPGTYG